MKFFKNHPLIENVLITAIFVLFFVIFFMPAEIDGNSMENTLYDGDFIIYSHFQARNIESGDIIVFEKEIDGDEITYVKRVIATPGDTVDIVDGKIYVNGQYVEENYIKDVQVETNYEGSDMSVTLGDGEYFVLGDNREISYDSRNFGVVYEDEIKGKVTYKIYPLREFERFR